jgi:hypothetical protein
MTFTFYKKYDESFLKERQIKWKLPSKENFNTLRLYYIVTVVYFLMAIKHFINSGNFWGFWMTGGFCFLILSIISGFSYYKTKADSYKIAKGCIIKYQQLGNIDIVNTFNQDIVSVKDPESYAEIRWSAFSHYQHYDNHLIFYLNNNNNPILVLDKEIIPQSEYDDFINLIRSKLTEKS